METRLLTKEHLEKLLQYLHSLGDETKSRFGPHNFDEFTLTDLFVNNENHRGYIVLGLDHQIIAYTVVRLGYLEHDQPRLVSYGLVLNHDTDCTLAPSVSDDHQGKGIGRSMVQFALSDLRTMGYQRVILWGGVQATNERARRLYQSLGFETLGEFEYHGSNLDMMCAL